MSATLPLTPPAADPGFPSRIQHVLDQALDQSHDIKAEVEACADDLRAVNDLAKVRIAGGATMLPAAQALSDGLAVELRVQGCAEDLLQVTDNLSQGVDEVKAIEVALHRSRAALAESQSALAVSRKAEHHASQQAMHDQKTGLPNRTLFDDRLAQAIAGAERHGWMLAVMFMDLDRFKLVNDTHGHAAGDAVLNTVAQRLLRNTRDEDSVCRNGGDEFLYLLINPTDRPTAERIARQVCRTIESPIDVGALRFSIVPSIGIALYPEHGTHGASLIAHADAAMYRAKQLGSQCEFFEEPAAAHAGSQPPAA